MQGQDQGVTLLEAARIVARGSELDAKLDALSGHVVSATGASAAVVYVLDPLGQLLVPAAHAGGHAEAIAAAGTISADDPDELVARAVRQRHIATGTANSSGAMALPLIAAYEGGGEDSEGALLVSFAAGAPESSTVEDTLSALADMCALAIRQARLENALQERADWIGRLANTDVLTGLANRVTFERMLELEIARAVRQGSQVSILLFDIDGFARLNDQAGAEAGDDVLRHVAATLAGQVRVVDTVARTGPDEFAMVAPASQGDIAARRIRDALGRVEAGGGPISVSVGIAVYPHDGATSEELIAGARAALQEAKGRGRGSIVAHTTAD